MKKPTLFNPAIIFFLVLILACITGHFSAKAEIKADTTMPTKNGKYAMVNGLKMYYEVHGTGKPLVMLHGGLSTIDQDYRKIIPVLSRDHRVIAIELQGHGHTPDIDRPLQLDFLAGDVRALLQLLKIDKADFCSYSLGGGASLQLAMEHPEMVDKLILISVAYNPEGYNPGVPVESLERKPVDVNSSPFKKAYLRAAPDTSKWNELVMKASQFQQTWKGWTDDQMRSVRAKTLLIFGDADLSRPEHATQMFRLFGGGPSGDFFILPGSQLAILPGTTHIQMMERTELLLPMIRSFLNK